MVPVSDSKQANIVICGQGRIGGELVKKLEEESIAFSLARIDSLKGLYAENELPQAIDLLVVCISARHRGQEKASWEWSTIFNGLIQQLHVGDLSIANIVMVSSTRVYEAYKSGIVAASKETRAGSPQGKGLAGAEKQLIASPMKALILRCSGLYGSLYPIYQPILFSGRDKPRFGIDAQKVVERLLITVKQVLTRQFEPGIELMTNGNVYFDGEVYTWPKDKKAIENLAENYRILINSKSR